MLRVAALPRLGEVADKLTVGLRTDLRGEGF